MDTSFRMLRVVRSAEETSLESPGPKEDWFCVHRVRSAPESGWTSVTDEDAQDFLLPLCCTDLIFLYRGLVIFHRNGFSMLNLSEYVFPGGSVWARLTKLLSFQCVDMPRQAGRNSEQKNLVRRCTSSQSLGMFRLQTETFLLCYDSKCTIPLQSIPT